MEERDDFVNATSSARSVHGPLTGAGLWWPACAHKVLVTCYTFGSIKLSQANLASIHWGHI